MTDLVSRLLEAIELTERYAESAGEADDNWEYRRGADVTPVPKDGSEGSTFDGGISWHPGSRQSIFAYWEEDLEHIVHHKPSSVLRRCAADRKILELHTPKMFETDEWDENRVLVDVEYLYCPRCWAAADYPAHSNPPERYPCDHVRLLAESYGLSDHQEGEE